MVYQKQVTFVPFCNPMEISYEKNTSCPCNLFSFPHSRPAGEDYDRYSMRHRTNRSKDLWRLHGADRVQWEAVKIMKDVDDSLSFIIGGSAYYTPDGIRVDWNRKVITGLRDIADYVSIHGYWDNSPDYYTYMGQSAMDIERKITTTADTISVVRSEYMMTRPIYISFDEWGAFGRGLLPNLQWRSTSTRLSDMPMW